jgi:hypothetical protein
MQSLSVVNKDGVRVQDNTGPAFWARRRSETISHPRQPIHDGDRLIVLTEERCNDDAASVVVNSQDVVQLQAVPLVHGISLHSKSMGRVHGEFDAEFFSNLDAR